MYNYRNYESYQTHSKKAERRNFRDCFNFLHRGFFKRGPDSRALQKKAFNFFNNHFKSRQAGFLKLT